MHINSSTPVNQRRSRKPTSLENVLGKLLITCGVIVSLVFLTWFLNPSFAGYKPLYYVIIFVFIYKILLRYIEWFPCFHLTVPDHPPVTKTWSVDVLTTYCKNEPRDMIEETLRAIQQISYPHRTFLCDETNDPELAALCDELGVTHVTRVLKVNAKAGNINNALNTVASGEICLILDPDHVPYPDFLDQVLPYFEDPQVGYVQVVQAYYNQGHTVVAKAAAQQTYQYYGPIMMGLNTMGSVPAIGANCTFRRAALDSIGGHAAGLTEDMHTAMLLHAKGWKSVYDPVIVAKGLVPWNYSGYCLQQLKWSRGSFDLLFKVIPRIWRQLSFKQLFYYLSAPFFYLMGLVSLLDFLIPIVSLITGLIPVKISVVEFVMYFTPVFVASFIIRQFNQRWLLERHEKGAFIFGGTLFKAAWWAMLMGFAYSLINHKVPYIPTPKDSKRETPVKLLLINIVVIAITLFAIIYGLSRDFNPFMVFMALLALTNVCVLGLGTLMGMQHFIIWVHQVMNGSFISKGSKTRTWVHDQKQIIFSFLQKFAGYIMICSLAVFVLVFKYSRDKVEDLKNPPNLFKHQYVPCLSGGDVSRMTAPLHFICDTFDLDSTTQSRALAFADTCHRHHKMPFFVVRFNQQQLTGFTPGLADSSFRGFFDLLRERYAPVFFSLIAANNCSDSSQLMLSRCLYTISEVADRASFPNVAWVWHSASPPGDPYISYNKHILSWVVVPRDSLVSCGPASIDPKLVIVASPGSMNVWKPSSNQPETLDLALFDRSPSAPAGSQRSLNGFYIKGMAYNPAHDWRDNKNNLPLTRKMLERDFSSIKAMGANTIRRYSSSIYDHNILSIAGEKDLKVLYGFWFDHQNNYLRDNDMKNDYHHQVLDFVARNKNNHTILGWGLGNETWGLLKRDFKEPYLSFVRIEYLDMIEHIAADIKRIDSLHPVFVMDEHTPRLSSSVYAFNRFAPCVDIFGVNSYYKPNIARVDSIMLHASPGKHYLVSEFGPKGYWQTAFNDYMFDTLLKEQDSYSKADWMEEQWKSYIVANKENNVGGVAFCWQDRFECTATWFGITDLYGNKRPAWYALARCFNTPASIPAQAAPSPFPVPRFFIVSSINTQWAGLTTRVSAITRRADSSSRANLWYKWMILEEGTFKKLHETEFVRGASEFTYKIPSTNAPCRLYLYVSDMNGNVISESKPLVIRTY